MHNVTTEKSKGGSVVTVKTNCGNVVDNFFVPKYNGETYCANSNGYFNLRFIYAVEKAKQIVAKRNQQQEFVH